MSCRVVTQKISPFKPLAFLFLAITQLAYSVLLTTIKLSHSLLLATNQLVCSVLLASN